MNIEVNPNEVAAWAGEFLARLDGIDRERLGLCRAFLAAIASGQVQCVVAVPEPDQPAPEPNGS